MNKSVRSAFSKILFPKFAATVDEQGVPNVVPLLSTTLADDRTAIFARMMIWKTARNLEQNGKVALATIGPGFKAYCLRGQFQGYQTSGEYVERYSQDPTFRYNAYMGATHVGVIELREAQGPLPLHALRGIRSRVRLLKKYTDYVPGPLSPNVQEKFSRRLGVKFLGWVDDQGMPAAFPCLGLYAPNPKTLAFDIPDDQHPILRLGKDAMVAASVLTLEPVAYQAKGRLEIIAGNGKGREGLIHLEEVYSAAPPLPGKRIFPPA